MDPAKAKLAGPYLLQVIESLLSGWVGCQVSPGLSPWGVLLWGCLAMLCSMSEPTLSWGVAPRTDDTFLSKAGRKEQGLT